MAVIRADLDSFIAGLPEVNAEVHRAAEASADRIRAAVPVRTGELLRSIKVTRANGKDYWVSAETSYVVPTNYGFYHVFAERYIAGLYYMKAGL